MSAERADAMYVYLLCDPRRSGIDSIAYVGLSSNPVRRLHRHLRAARRAERSPVARWLRSLRRRPELHIFAVTTRDHGAIAERAVMMVLRAFGAPLVNRGKGGEGIVTLADVERVAAGMRRLWTKPEYRERHAARMRLLWSDPRRRARWLRSRKRRRYAKGGAR